MAEGRLDERLKKGDPEKDDGTSKRSLRDQQQLVGHPQASLVIPPPRWRSALLSVLTDEVPHADDQHWLSRIP